MSWTLALKGSCASELRLAWWDGVAPVVTLANIASHPSKLRCLRVVLHSLGDDAQVQGVREPHPWP